MTSSPPEIEPAPDFQLRFRGSTAEHHQMPAEVLAASIEALQKIVHILAMEHESRGAVERLRIPETIAARYAVLCDVPAEGSYAQPFQIGALKPDLITLQDLGSVREDFVRAISALYSQQTEKLLSVASDRVLRKRLITAFRGLLPKAGSGFSVTLDDFKTQGPTSYLFADRHALYLRQVSERADERHVPQTVTGRLDKIDFGERSVTIIYPPTSRQLKCTYDEGSEEMLLEQRRALIQVTGIVALDEDDNPQRVTDVQAISYLDLSPFEIEEFEFDNFRLRFRAPLTLSLQLDESEQLLCIEDEDWSLNVFAPSREQLWEELREQMEMLWTEYAREADVNLSAPALALKQRLLAGMEETSRTEEIHAA